MRRSLRSMSASVASAGGRLQIFGDTLQDDFAKRTIVHQMAQGFARLAQGIDSRQDRVIERRNAGRPRREPVPGPLLVAALVIQPDGVRRIPKRSALRSPAYQYLTFAFAPRSTDRTKSADGNLAFMDSTRPSGFSARFSSSSNTTRYLSVKSTAVLASRGAPTLLCPGITTEGSSALILLSVFNHSPLAPLSVSAV